MCLLYHECEEKKRLKENCCKQCQDYDYCMEEELYDDNNIEGYGY